LPVVGLYYGRRICGKKPVTGGETVTVGHQLRTESVFIAVLPVFIILALCFVVLGCPRKKAETKLPLTLSKPQTAYVYIPALMPAHPLYAELSALHEHIDALRGVGWPAVAEEIDRLYDSPVLAPLPISGEMGGVDQYRHKWLAGQQWDISGGVLGLPGDLQAQLRWQSSRIDREVLRQLQDAAAQESQWLAYLQIEAMLRRQGEVSNQELDLDEPAEVASEKADQLRHQIIEQAVAEELEAGEVRREELHQALEQNKRQALAEIRSKLQTQAEQRHSYGAATGHKLREQLIQRIEQFTGDIASIDRPTVGPAPTAQQLQQAGQDRADAQKEYNQAVAAQIERLLARKMVLTVAIEQATRRAAQRIAWEENLDLHLLPGDDRAGDDITPLIAEKLTAIWASPRPTAQEGNNP